VLRGRTRNRQVIYIQSRLILYFSLTTLIYIFPRPCGTFPHNADLQYSLDPVVLSLTPLIYNIPWTLLYFPSQRWFTYFPLTLLYFPSQRLFTYTLDPVVLLLLTLIYIFPWPCCTFTLNADLHIPLTLVYFPSQRWFTYSLDPVVLSLTTLIYIFPWPCCTFPHNADLHIPLTLLYTFPLLNAYLVDLDLKLKKNPPLAPIYFEEHLIQLTWLPTPNNQLS
jgi:hypothetical protein